MTINRQRTPNRSHTIATQHKSCSSTLGTALHSHVTSSISGPKIFRLTLFPQYSQPILRVLNRALWYTYVIRINKMHSLYITYSMVQSPSWEANNIYINLLAPELFFLILPHLVKKMWIIREPNMLDLWNKLHSEEEKTKESIYRV